jgi:BCD family chlorophyll transporter-like MFS transporter
MNRLNAKLVNRWMRIGTELLPFAESATDELPLGRMFRLALFQVSVGVAMVLLIGTLNRVLIVELGVPAWQVAAMVGLPLAFAPFRALIGFRSDNHFSALGWRRVPYIWMGTMLQFGGLAIMPFALLILSGDTHGPIWIGQAASAFAFLLVGAGMQITQTAGLALATDLAPESVRPDVIALMYTMLLVGMVAAGLVFGQLLANFSEIRLIQVIQGAAVLTVALNCFALWKQEARNTARMQKPPVAARFRDSWRAFAQRPGSKRFLVAVGLGTAAFNMQDIILEPYGGQILHLSVSATTSLTAMLAAGSLAAFCLAARFLVHGADPYRIAAYGVLIGLVAFAAVIFAAPMESPLMFRMGTALIGFGAGFFLVGTLAGAMARERNGENGLVLGAWGAAQAASAGLAIVLGGVARDVVTSLALRGSLGQVMSGAATGYTIVYQAEIFLLFATLIAIGPLVRSASSSPAGITDNYTYRTEKPCIPEL